MSYIAQGCSSLSYIYTYKAEELNRIEQGGFEGLNFFPAPQHKHNNGHYWWLCYSLMFLRTACRHICDHADHFVSVKCGNAAYRSLIALTRMTFSNMSSQRFSLSENKRLYLSALLQFVGYESINLKNPCKLFHIYRLKGRALCLANYAEMWEMGTDKSI